MFGRVKGDMKSIAGSAMCPAYKKHISMYKTKYATTYEGPSNPH